MQFIFCNSKKPLKQLEKYDNIISCTYDCDEILKYYSDNTLIITDFDSDKYKKEQNKLNIILQKNKLYNKSMGTSIWVPIDEPRNYGLCFTSTIDVYWAYISTLGLIEKLPFKIKNIIFDISDFLDNKFEDNIIKAMTVKRKFDIFPDIKNIYHNP